MGFLETEDGPGMLPYADPYESPYEEEEDVPVTNWDRPEPPWKDED